MTKKFSCYGNGKIIVEIHFSKTDETLGRIISLDSSLNHVGEFDKEVVRKTFIIYISIYKYI